MRTTVLFIAIVCMLSCSTSATSQSKTYRKTLQQPADIQGYSCANGYVWFYSDGQLKHCTVASETLFGEIRIPAGTYITLLPDGKPATAQMIHDTSLLGITCQGGSFLGPSEGSTVAFYPSGKLKACFLADDQLVQNVPCSHGGFFTTLFGIDPRVDFYESGKLKSCRLSKNFGALRRGQRVIQKD